MHINQFENSISKIFITRGKKYFRDGHVVELTQISPTAWRAEVEGTDDYFVFVELADGRIATSVCNCPFDGPHCKHEVAVYYAMREALAAKRQFTLPEAVRTQSKEALLVILEKMVSDYPALKEYLGVQKKAAKAKEMTIQDAQKLIQKKLDRYSDYNGYVDDEIAFEGFHEVLDYAQNAVDEHPVEAVALVLYCQEEAGDSYYRCEDWLLDELMSEIHEVGYSVIGRIETEAAATNVTIHLLTELRRLARSGDDESMILTMLIELSALAQSRETIEGILETLSLTEHEKEEYLFQLIMAVGTDEEMTSYYTREPLSPGLRTQIIDAAVSRGHIEAALTLCANGIDERDVPAHLKELWLRKAFHLHGQQGNTGAQRFIAFELAVKGDMDDFTRLKSLYEGDEELWADVLENYVQTLEENPLPGHYATFLVQEEQWARLLRYCQLEPSCALNYASALKPYYEAEVKELVSRYLQDKVHTLNSRGPYKNFANELLSYANSGYREHALALKASFTATYAKKRAFMEELQIIR